MLKKSQFSNKVEATITAQPKPIDKILGDVVLHLIAAQGISISKRGVTAKHWSTSGNALGT